MAKALRPRSLVSSKEEKKEDVYLTCLKCGVKRKEVNFYKSRNKLVSQEFSLCKKCIGELMDVGTGAELISNVQHIFRILDYPFFTEIWDDCKGQDNTFSTYLKKINSPNSKYYSMAYKDGQDILVLGTDPNEESNNIARWGQGFNDVEYSKMNKIADDYIKLTGKEDFKSIKDFERVAKATINVDRVYCNVQAKPQDIKYAEELVTSLMKEAGLAYAQMSSTNKASSLGEWIDIFETHDPIAEPTEEFRDVDGIGKYIERFFYKNLMRVFGKDSSKISDEFKEVRKELKNKEKKFGGI